MPYQPGPLLLQDASNAGITTSIYNFAADADLQLQELTLTPATWQYFLDDAGVLLDGPADPFPDVDLNGAIDMLNAYADPPTEIGINALQDALGTANLGLAAAIGYAPAEAWYDASTPFVPPAPAPVVNVPVIPSDALSFAVTGSVSTDSTGDGSSSTTTGAPADTNTFGSPPAGSTPIGLFPVSVSLTNLTAYGNAVFHVGDQFQVDAVGIPGNQVQVSATHDGVTLPLTVAGVIGADRTFRLNGQMDFSSVGVWEQVWFLGSTLAGTFSFIVRDQ